jgi:peptidoglycan/xylan/chitin deacetylase (PgdA/CDA1 family)
MRRLAVAAGIVLLATGMSYAGYRAYGRSLPEPPAVVMRDADVKALLEPALDTRVKQAVLGEAAGQVAGPKLIALTFDDGPYPVDTPVLLATLRAAHVQATFFLIGRDAEQYPGLVRAIAADGNEIANHTETHPNLDELDPAAVTAELSADVATLTRLVPQRDPMYAREFRPPHGRFTPETLVAAQQAGYDTILWTDDPGDWRNVSRDVLADHIARYATSPEIVLLHNGRPETVALLPDMIQRFRNAGYTFLTVSELLRRVGPDALNHAARTPLPPQNS